MGKKVCVIGAGPSGIAAAKNLLDEGHQIIVYDYGQDVGGNWVFSENESHSSVFETTHIISSKKLSEYHDYPMPDDYPDYPSHRQLAAYFQRYAKHFGLYPYIQFRTLVQHCTLLPDGTWEVQTLRDGHSHSEQFDALAVCNGHHWLPRMPHYEGNFDGRIIHSHQVKRFEAFRNQKVLVIGGGNSACDVAVETSRLSAYTHLSWRRGYWITPKFVFGQPTDIVGNKMQRWLPRFIFQKISQFTVWTRFGSNALYGLPKPTHGIGETHITINDELYYMMRHGKVQPKPDIARLDAKNVHFKDGSQGEYDTIIACTGYVISHPFFDKNLIDYSEGSVPLYLRMLHPKIQSVYFIGLFQPLGCIWPAAELQSKIMARELASKWQRPHNIAQKIEAELRNPDFNQIDTPRHTITVSYYHFHKRLMKELK